MMRRATTTIRVISVCVLVLAVASPAWGQLVTGGLIGGHDAGLYGGSGPWNDAVTGDGYDATGTLGGDITHTAAAGGDPGYFSGFSSCAGGDDACQITLDLNSGMAVGTGDFTYAVWVNKSDPGQGRGLGQALTLGLSAVVALAYIRFGRPTAAAAVRYEPNLAPPGGARFGECS